jgi:hypothetical protein
MTLREFLLLTAPVTLTEPIILPGQTPAPDLRPRRPVTVVAAGQPQPAEA